MKVKLYKIKRKVLKYKKYLDFDIISLNNYDMNYKMGLYGKKPATSTW